MTGINRRMAIVVMPDSPAAEPYHCAAVLAGIVGRAGWQAQPHDVNIELFKHVSPDLRAGWHRNRYNENDDFPDQLLSRHGEWLAERLDRIIASRPAIIGFTVNVGTHRMAVFAGRYVKNKAPDILVMFGGPNCFPGEVHRGYVDGPHAGACDVMCQGEAEVALPQFLREFERTGVAATTVGGFLYLRDGVVVDTGMPELPDMRRDIVRADFSGFDLAIYPNRGSLPFQFSRGCPYRCRFCRLPKLFPRFRVRDAAEAFEEVRDMAALVAARGDRFFLRISDPNFNSNIKEMVHFLDLLIDSGLAPRWRALTRIDPRLTTDILDRMKRSGCSSVFWGVESGSQEVVDLMVKNFRIGDARRIIREASRLGIGQEIPIILGFPGEQASDVAQSIAFVLEFRAYPKVVVYPPAPVKLLPNSILGHERDTWGLTTDKEVPTEWRTEDGVNTPAVRQLRVFIGRNAQGNAPLTRDETVDPWRFAELDFTNPVVAREYWDLIVALVEAAGDSAPLPEMPGGVADLEQWMALDKTAPGLRDEMQEVIFAVLRRLHEAVLRRADQDPEGPLLRPAPGMKAVALRGWLDRAEVEGDDLVVSGWAFEPARPDQPVDLAVYSGRRLVCRHRAAIQRPDVTANHGPKVGPSGFEFRVPRAELTDWTALMVLTADGGYGHIRGDFARLGGW